MRLVFSFLSNHIEVIPADLDPRKSLIFVGVKRNDGKV
jgi:hypothetical protein